MRLLLLSEHTDKIDQHAQMQNAFLQEQGQTAFITSVNESFLIENDSQIVGFAKVSLEEECFPDEDLPEICLKIQAFYIRPEFRDKTLGRQAFKLLRQWGRDNKAALVETEVSTTLDFSHDFLKDQGLELVGTGKKDVFRGFI